MEKMIIKSIVVSSLLFCLSAWADAPSASNPAAIGLDSSASEASPSKVEVKPAMDTAPSAGPSVDVVPPVEFHSQEMPQGSASMSTPIERAKGEKLATAMGHYARARSLVVAAIREFDKGYAIVDPNALLDTRMWRDSLLDRADELARLLDPQPRATKGGVKFGAETRGIGDTSR